MQPDASSRALLSRVLLPIFRASCAVAVHAQSPLLLPNALGGVEQEIGISKRIYISFVGAERTGYMKCTLQMLMNDENNIALTIENNK